MTLALKVDVDTCDGMRDGVPNFLNLFKALKIRASFFVPFGPDESGKAVFRVFKKKGFLAKMFRTNALRLYGFKTMLRGTLLPAPMIGASFPELARRIAEEGHELGIHGYNHVLWQDHLPEMSADQVAEEMERAAAGFERVMKSRPRAFAAPAWLCTPHSLQIEDEMKLDYASDTRGKSPFFPIMNGTRYRTLQIPSTLPTLDELLGENNIDSSNVGAHLNAVMAARQLECEVHSIHTEVEGTALFSSFSEWLNRTHSAGARFTSLSEIAAQKLLSPDTVPVCEIKLLTLPGRAGPVACQTE